MNDAEQTFILIFLAMNAFLSFRGFVASYREKNPTGLTPILLPLGIFVWADAVVLGIFWIVVSVLSLVLHDWVLFLLLYSLFWIVRSIGESIYWFNQQFSPIIRTNPKGTFLFSLFHDTYTVWFVLQLIHECITVFAILASLYLGRLWLAK